MNDMVVLAKSGEAVKAGPIGFAVIILLCIACYFLFKSMSKHLRKVREQFPSDQPATAPPATAARADEQSAPTDTAAGTTQTPGGYPE
jgi:hypothetical protein